MKINDTSLNMNDKKRNCFNDSLTTNSEDEIKVSFCEYQWNKYEMWWSNVEIAWHKYEIENCFLYNLFFGTKLKCLTR